MNILLLGKNGQVGQELQRSLLPLAPLTALGRAEADLSQPGQIDWLLGALQPTVVVNAAAHTAVDRAESEPELAWRVNAESVDRIARWCAKHNARLVHYSTDYVFDGSGATPWVEDAPCAPLSTYGRSKRAGEEAILASGAEAVILRTSWVYARHGGNFIKTMLRLAGEREHLRVVADQVGAPTSAELLADVTALLLHHGPRRGIFHLAPVGETSWHGLASYAIDAARQRGAHFKVQGIEPIATADYPTPARRPLNSRLSTQKLQEALGITLPEWQRHVDRLIAQLYPST